MPDWTRCTVLHVDMDAFFAAVEVLDDPMLAGKAVIVGGDGQRGVVASCTYEARAYGVRSAMSSVEARRRCPHALFVSGRYWRYSEVSEQMHQVLRTFSPVVEAIGLDEAFVDVGGTGRGGPTPPETAWALRDAVRNETGLQCSVGVARTKLLAKLASEAAKPIASHSGTRPGAGVVAVDPDKEMEFLLPLPVRALWGVGPATAARLAALGIITVADLAAVPEQSLCRSLGDSHGHHLASLARGEDVRQVEADRAVKSVGHEETFATDLHDHQSLHRHAVQMADAVCARMQEAGLVGRTVTLKDRFADRTTITRSQSVPTATGSARAVRAIALSLLGGVEVNEGVRLLGVSVSHLADSAPGVQLSFDDVSAVSPARAVAGGGSRADSGIGSDAGSGDGPDAGEPAPSHELAWAEIEAAMAAIRARYGQSAVAPAALVSRGGVSVKRRGDTQWGPSDQDERSR